MSLVVKTVARWLRDFIFLFGLSLALSGHQTPGGGFAGGLVIACSLILIVLANGERIGIRTLSKDTAWILVSLSGLLFVGVSLAGFWKTWLFPGNGAASADTLQAECFAIGAIHLLDLISAIIVSMLIYLLFLMLSSLHVRSKAGQRKMVRRGRE